MERFLLTVFQGSKIIYYEESRSITSTAKCINRFQDHKKNGFEFDIYDSFKGRTIDVEELMKVWNS